MKYILYICLNSWTGLLASVIFLSSKFDFDVEEWLRASVSYKSILRGQAASNNSIDPQLCSLERP